MSAPNGEQASPVAGGNPLLELLAPIPGDNPSGVPLRYDPVYDKIKVARKEDPDLPGFDWQTRKLAEWPKVIKLSTTVLATQSKDLQIAAWLTEAWLREEGFAGMRKGIDLIRGLMEQYWDTLYPELDGDDPSFRAAPVEWIGGGVGRYPTFDTPIRSTFVTSDKRSFLDYATSLTVPTKLEAEGDSSGKKSQERSDAIAQKKITPEEFDDSFNATKKDHFRKLVADIQGTLQALDALDQLSQGKFGEAAPSMARTRETLEEVSQTAEQLLARKLQLDPDPITVEMVDGIAMPSGGAAASSASSAMVNIAAGPQSSEEAGHWIAAAARHIRRERPTEPTAYLLLRGYRWGELRTPDRRVDPKMLVAPSTDLRSRLKEMLIDNRWPELLNAAEEVLAQPIGRGWLDLQRYALTASDGLGSDYESVSAAMRSALRSLLLDVPSLPAQTLMDDSPTANVETMGWLRDEKLLPEGTDTIDIPTFQPRTTGLRRDVYEVAQARSRAGDARGAMELLMHESEREKSPRARFLRRSQAADIMVGSGMESVALPILRDLLQQIQTFRLEEWEAGDTVAQPLALLYRCVTRVGGGDIDANELYDRVCRLDPVRAIQIKAPHEANEGT